VTAEAPKLFESRMRTCVPPVVMLAFNRTVRSATVTPVAPTVLLAPQVVIQLELPAAARRKPKVSAVIESTSTTRIANQNRFKKSPQRAVHGRSSEIVPWHGRESPTASEELNCRRHRYELFYFRSQQIEVAHIPRVKMFRSGFERARRD